MEQCRPYNLSKLLYYKVKFTPKKKRLSFIENINQDQEMWKDSDDLKDYRKGIVKSFSETVNDYAVAGADIGSKIGSIFGDAGENIGRAVGGVAGFFAGTAKAILDVFGGGSGGGWLRW
ncbi:hypothetical protein [Lacrimispora celerecrescens]|uniref:Glycine zipper domain-containing protein n=1 Tax=Lacrimispora celerecrescens TaxID=29354 RepID=A0A084JBU9_9FIRM|nr:hypothetical protein [Lacrimispora celerecrescens]KEZ86433.1 hypothetical protein IO98_23080 [Lacrimispora celerecrescens]